ncbi:MAG TPA: carboxypeptidase-like regulatory domain-containing protein [Acidobacteriaceae bacterium]|nr:carboxypeptidase-like regulatory domain-containing protein [Acidobacteriaceae bacterium]
MRRPLPSFLRLPLAGSVALCLCWALLAAHAQNLSGASGFAVRGTVLNDATGQPVARAEVVLGNDQAQLTAGDGTFSFDNVSAGSFSVAVRKPGYLGFGHSSSSQAGPPRSILVGPEMPALTFRITPEAGIFGHITLSTADPADEIQVSIFRRDLQDGRPHWSLAAIEKTRSDGSWRVAGLAPGRYMVFTDAWIDGQNDPENSLAPVFGFPGLYYPGVTDAGSAGVLALRAGQQAQADMTLVRQQFFPVAIAIQGMPDTPTSLTITDSGGQRTGLPVHLDPRSRVAHANVPNGAWTLIAHAFGATMRFGRANFQVGGAPVDLALTVTPLPPLQFIINRDFTASADGAPPSNQWGWMNLSLLPADDFAEGAGIRSVHSDDGSNGTRYELDVFQPGKFWVSTTNPGSTYVASVSSGGADLATTPLTVSPDNPPQPVEVTLRNDSGTIAGQIDSPSPRASGVSGEQPQIWIYAIPLFSTTNRVPDTLLRDNNQFTLPNLAPGSYRVVACDARQEIDFHSTEGLAAWSGKGQVVTVDPSGTANVELTVIHGDPSP